jgi:hypothetical protein
MLNFYLEKFSWLSSNLFSKLRVAVKFRSAIPARVVVDEKVNAIDAGSPARIV